MVRYYQYQDKSELSDKDIELRKNELLDVANIFSMDSLTLEKLQNSFSEIEQSVSVLAEFLIQND